MDVVWRATLEGWRRLARLPTAAGVFDWEWHSSFDCFWWAGSPGASAHQLWLNGAPPNVDVAAEIVSEVLASPGNRAGCDVAIRCPDSPDAGPLFDRLAATGVRTSPLMLCELHRLPPPKPSEFRTTIAADRTALIELAGRVYDDPHGLTAFFNGPGVVETIAALDGDQLVSSAGVAIIDEVANIWSVATAEHARGRGAASAAVTAALQHAGRSGCRWACLGTTDDLVPWYARLGFTEVGRERSALLPPRRQKVS